MNFWRAIVMQFSRAVIIILQEAWRRWQTLMEELEKEFPTAGRGKVPKFIPIIFAQYQLRVGFGSRYD